VQADELRVKMQGAIVWMAMAVMVTTRLWLGGEVSPHRDLSLIRRLMQRVRRCALVGLIEAHSVWTMYYLVVIVENL
jgi:hypothetical protein